MLKITITTTAIQTKSGTSAKTGKPYEIREQPAWIHLTDEQGRPQAYPSSMMLMLEKNQLPYAMGDYILHPSSIRAGRFGALDIKPVLLPAKEAVKVAA